MNDNLQLEEIKRIFDRVETWINSLPIEDCIVLTRYYKDYCEFTLTDKERGSLELKDCPSTYLKELLCRLTDFHIILPQYLELITQQLEEKYNEQ